MCVSLCVCVCGGRCGGGGAERKKKKWSSLLPVSVTIFKTSPYKVLQLTPATSTTVNCGCRVHQMKGKPKCAYRPEKAPLKEVPPRSYDLNQKAIQQTRCTVCWTKWGNEPSKRRIRTDTRRVERGQILSSPDPKHLKTPATLATRADRARTCWATKWARPKVKNSLKKEKL